MLEARSLSVEAGAAPLLAGAAFTVAPGDKVGLVGRNGAGKTSLLNVLAGEAEPLEGSVLRKGSLGFLSQEPMARDLAAETTAREHVLSGRGLDVAVARLEKLRVALEASPTERNLARFAAAEEELRSRGGYSAEPEAERLLAGLGLRPDRNGAALRGLSGGERRRVELARILFAGADVLLLDEPTNPLDVDAREWLLGFLRSYRGALVVVSHDLALLDSSITRVLHLDRADGPGRLVEYRGTYSAYLRARAADEERAARLAERQAGEIRRLSDLADQMRHQSAKRARKAKTLDRRVERLRSDRPDAPTRARSVRVSLPDPPHCGRSVLEVEGLTKGFPGLDLFSDVSLTLGRGERLMVMGLNGAGKTTLLRILAGELAADSGRWRLGLSVSAGYYAQEHEGLIPGEDVLSHMRAAADVPASVLRGVLGTLGLSGDVAFQDVATLSGGEKTKLALAQLVAGRHNLLLLDEPTNNLDPASRGAVGSALASWGGAMVVVSHDTELVESLEPDQVLIMPDGTLDRWSDDMAELVALA
ncbi:MAG: ABC-F family ATP-binding cassette domain-containing protein [Acidimicrobiales bacterium]